jgi:hypothetical protein
MEFFGVELVGFNAESGKKLLLTLAPLPCCGRSAVPSRSRSSSPRSRSEILKGLGHAGIRVASTTIEIAVP